MEDLAELADLLIALPVPDDAGQHFEFQLLLPPGLGAFGLEKNVEKVDCLLFSFLFCSNSLPLASTRWVLSM